MGGRRGDCPGGRGAPGQDALWRGSPAPSTDRIVVPPGIKTLQEGVTEETGRTQPPRPHREPQTLQPRSQCETAFCSLFPAWMLPREGRRDQRVSTHSPTFAPVTTETWPRPSGPRVHPWEPPQVGHPASPRVLSRWLGFCSPPTLELRGARRITFPGLSAPGPQGPLGTQHRAQVLAASLPQDGLPYTPCQARSFRKCGAGEPRGHGPPHPDLAGQLVPRLWCDYTRSRATGAHRLEATGSPGVAQDTCHSWARGTSGSVQPPFPPAHRTSPQRTTLRPCQQQWGDADLRPQPLSLGQHAL